MTIGERYLNADTSALGDARLLKNGLAIAARSVVNPGIKGRLGTGNRNLVLGGRPFIVFNKDPLVSCVTEYDGYWAIDPNKGYVVSSVYSAIEQTTLALVRMDPSQSGTPTAVALVFGDFRGRELGRKLILSLGEPDFIQRL